MSASPVRTSSPAAARVHRVIEVARLALKKPVSRVQKSGANVRKGSIVLKNPAAAVYWMWSEPKLGGRVIGVPRSCGEDRLRAGDQLGELAEVLGDCSEVKFIAGAARPAQP